MESSSNDLDDTYAETSSILKNLAKHEELGQQIVAGKKLLVEYDEGRQNCREALRSLRNPTKLQEDYGDGDWICLGDTLFLNLPKEKTIGLIENDMETIEKAIDGARNELKQNLDQLRAMESEKSLRELGFDLNPIT